MRDEYRKRQALLGEERASLASGVHQAAQTTIERINQVVEVTLGLRWLTNALQIRFPFKAISNKLHEEALARAESLNELRNVEFCVESELESFRYETEGFVEELTALAKRIEDAGKPVKSSWQETTL